MSNKNAYRVTIQLTVEEEEMIKLLRSKYSINMSQLFKNTIKDLYDKMEPDDE